MLINIILIIVGFVLLLKGGDYLVDGSVAIARHARLSNMVIGLTVIGFGTSMPELLVSAQAALGGSPGIAIGNVVGSNIANIALILGLSALICPLPSSRSILRTDIPFMILSCIVLVAIGLTDHIGRLSGALMFALLVVFVWWQVHKSRKSSASQSADDASQKPMPLWRALIVVICSFTALVIGSKMLVRGASDIAASLGVSERIIGLTIVAVGTSLPELFASVMAARKGESDMAIGNIVGSVSFNCLSVIGVSSMICPINSSRSGFVYDYIIMCILGLMLWLFLRTHHKIVRWEGAILFLSYVVYLVYTVANV
ncbi:MAG: calcium/sodium antiporter [Bacteroidales bacterium]|nr:calcium/sodium antiporter [Candidatus Liminaster caballi]